MCSHHDHEAEMQQMEVEGDRLQTARDERNKHAARSAMEQTDIFAGLDGTLEEGHEEATSEDMRGKFSDALVARQFLRAGKAIVTLVSTKTGNRFTYKVTKSDDGNCHFVALLNGPDNTSNYKYLGRIAREIFFKGRKTPKAGDIATDAPSMLAFDFAWRHLVQGSIPANLEIWHEGSCGRCGRRLTVPASIARGFGPECSERMGF